MPISRATNRETMTILILLLITAVPCMAISIDEPQTLPVSLKAENSLSPRESTTSSSEIPTTVASFPEYSYTSSPLFYGASRLVVPGPAMFSAVAEDHIAFDRECFAQGKFPEATSSLTPTAPPEFKHNVVRDHSNDFKPDAGYPAPEKLEPLQPAGPVQPWSHEHLLPRLYDICASVMGINPVVRPANQLANFKQVPSYLAREALKSSQLERVMSSLKTVRLTASRLLRNFIKGLRKNASGPPGSADDKVSESSGYRGQNCPSSSGSSAGTQDAEPIRDRDDDATTPTVGTDTIQEEGEEVPYILAQGCKAKDCIVRVGDIEKVFLGTCETIAPDEIWKSCHLYNPNDFPAVAFVNPHHWRRQNGKRVIVTPHNGTSSYHRCGNVCF